MVRYVAIPIDRLRKMTRDISFDVYIRLSEDNYAHVFSRTTGLDYKRLAQYIQKGLTELHIREEDQVSYDAFMARPAEVIFHDPHVSPERKIAVLLNITEQNMAEVFSSINVSEETVQSTEKVIKNYVELMVESPKSLAVILKLVSHGDYLYYHSIAVSIFSLLLGKSTGLFNPRNLEVLGMGAFLHDVGSAASPSDLIDAPRELSPQDWQLVKSHPKIGLQMLEKTANVPDEVRFIVYQHHEETGGAGYPNGLRGDAIYYPAKLVAVVDGFTALISKRALRAAFTPEEAIQILQSCPEKFDRDLVKLLASIFVRSAGSGSHSSAA